MNVNYVNSLAARFVKLRSGILVTEESTPEVFNTIEVFVPSNIAVANIAGIDIANVKDAPVVVHVNSDNYSTVLKDALLSQWRPLFNDGANVDAKLVLVVFYVPDGSGTDTFADYLTVGEKSIEYAPLSTAFELVYPASFFKTLFSPTYNGVTPGIGYDDQNYFDFALCLAQLCLAKPELSYFIAQVIFKLPVATPDTNVCKALSVDADAEIAAATAFNVVIPGVTNPRRDYFYGMLALMQASNTWVIAHSENTNLIPIILGNAFMSTNASGTYIGNKLTRVRLTGNGVKPMGVPSILDSAINVNLSLDMSERLDKKNIAYLFSISDGTGNDSVLSYARGITGKPVISVAISKYVDYFSAQTIANMIADVGTTSQPVLKNEKTYAKVQEIIISFLQKFARTGRIIDIYLGFPPYADLPASDTDITVTQGWQALYVDDIDHITITGTVVV